MQTNASRLIALICMSIDITIGLFLLFIQVSQYFFEKDYFSQGHSFISYIPHFIGTGIIFFLPAFGSYVCYRYLVNKPTPNFKRTIITLLPIFFLFISIGISFWILWIIAQIFGSF